MWTLERTPRDTEYSGVWEESVSTIIIKRNEKNMVLNYGVDCEPWKGHHWILEKPKGKVEIRYKE